MRSTADELWKAVKKGWNLNEQSVKYGSQEQRLLIQMRHNTFVTAVFKNHHFALDMARELFNEKGEVRSFNAFKDAVKTKVDPNYNKNWLRTEYNTAYASGQMARKWQGYVRKGGFIEYVAVMDGRTRYEHAQMNKARYPVDHPFWLAHYPPNGYNCRCTTRWDGTEGGIVPAESIVDIPPSFQNNVGMTGIVFKDLPYFTVDSHFQQQAENLFGFRPPVDPSKYAANVELYNRLIEDKSYKLSYVDNLTGGFVFRHANTTAREIAHSINAAKVLARNGDNIIIRQAINAPGIKNPDILLNGVVSEIKVNSAPTINAIDGALRMAKTQAELVVLDIQSSIKPADLEQAIYGRIRRSPGIKKVIVVFNDTVYELTREEILMRTFMGKIK